MTILAPTRKERHSSQTQMAPTGTKYTGLSGSSSRASTLISISTISTL